MGPKRVKDNKGICQGLNSALISSSINLWYNSWFCMSCVTKLMNWYHLRNPRHDVLEFHLICAPLETETTKQTKKIGSRGALESNYLKTSLSKPKKEDIYFLQGTHNYIKDILQKNLLKNRK